VEQGEPTGGRPSKYEKKFNKQAYKLCLLGATDKDLAAFFEVVESTINEWKISQEGFSESIKRGKVQADSEVAKSLFKRATGYSHKDTDIRVCDGVIVQTPLIKHYPPDSTSMIFWLKNRQSKVWRDKQEIDHTSKGNELKRFTLNVKPDTE
jgi:hypothetical protein